MSRAKVVSLRQNGRSSLISLIASELAARSGICCSRRGSWLSRATPVRCEEARRFPAAATAVVAAALVPVAVTLLLAVQACIATFKRLSRRGLREGRRRDGRMGRSSATVDAATGVDSP